MPAKKHLDMAVTVLTAACALVVTALVARRELSSTAHAAGRGPEQVAEWEQYATGAKSVGPSTASVTIVEFSDFQCPFCATLHGKLQRIMEERPNDVRVVYRSMPITSRHPFAWDAALTAECAAVQGRFGKYHDELFQSADSIGSISWGQFAVRAGISDTVGLETCRTSATALERLQADTAAANRLQVHGTPTILINGWRFEGVPADSVLDRLIEREIAESR
jgi:protein-disulfide isomerase